MSARLEERMVTIAWRDAGESLEGIWLAGDPDAARGAVIAPPHPLYGGSMESPVVSELAWACARHGIASLRFNWRGVGASAGQPSGEAADADEDYAAALAHQRESTPGRLVACGYSFGAAAALRTGGAHPRVDRLVLVAPPPALLPLEQLAATGKRLLVIVGEEDPLAPPAALEAALDGVAGARLEVIPEADHFFGAGLAQLGRAASDWLAG